MKYTNSKPITEILDYLITLTASFNKISLISDFQISCLNEKVPIVQLILHKINPHKQAIGAMHKAIPIVLKNPWIISLFDND